jgi:hypothetical protein
VRFGEGFAFRPRRYEAWGPEGIRRIEQPVLRPTMTPSRQRGLNCIAQSKRRLAGGVGAFPRNGYVRVMALADEELRRRLSAWQAIRPLSDAGTLDAATVNSPQGKGLRLFYGGRGIWN